MKIIWFMFFPYSILVVMISFATWARMPLGSAIPENMISLYLSDIEKLRDPSHSPLKDEMQHWLKFFILPRDINVHPTTPITIYAYPEGSSLTLAKAIATGTRKNVSFRTTSYGKLFYGNFRVNRHILNLLLLLFFYGFAFALFAAWNAFGSKKNIKSGFAYFGIAYSFCLCLPLLQFFPVLFYTYNLRPDNRLLSQHKERLQLLLENPNVASGIHAFPESEETLTRYNWLHRLPEPLWPLRSQVHEMQKGSIFIGKPPFFQNAYARYSVDFLRHIFYFPSAEKSSLKEINPDLSFKDMGNGFILGYYRGAITGMELAKGLYCLIVIVWGAVMVKIIAVAYKTIKKPKTRG